MKPPAAALRELYEEADITARTITTMLGSSNTVQSGERWHFFFVQTDPLPDSWHHQSADAGGQLFGFFWHPVRQQLPDSFEYRFHKALHFIRAQLDLLPVALKRNAAQIPLETEFEPHRYRPTP